MAGVAGDRSGAAARGRPDRGRTQLGIAAEEPRPAGVTLRQVAARSGRRQRDAHHRHAGPRRTTDHHDSDQRPATAANVTPASVECVVGSRTGSCSTAEHRPGPAGVGPGDRDAGAAHAGPTTARPGRTSARLSCAKRQAADRDPVAISQSHLRHNRRQRQCECPQRRPAGDAWSCRSSIRTRATLRSSGQRASNCTTNIPHA